MVGLKTDSNMWKVRLLVIHFVLPVRYISAMIQRRSGTLRIGILASDSDQFQWHFREFEADY